MYGEDHGIGYMELLRAESEAIIGNGDRREKASFVSESGEKYDIMPMYAEQQSQE